MKPNPWLFGSGSFGSGSGAQWPPLGPNGYPVGAGASATDPGSMPGYTGPPNKSGSVPGPGQYFPGQANNPFDANNVFKPQPPAPAPASTGGGSGSGKVTITIDPGGSTSTSGGGSTTAPPPPAPVAPPPPAPLPEPVNSAGRTNAEELDWQARVKAQQDAATQSAIDQQNAATAQAAASDAAALDQLKRTDAQGLADEYSRRDMNEFQTWTDARMNAINTWIDQWRAYVAQVNAMPDPNWNDLPVFQIINGLMPAPSFQARGQAATNALAGPTMPTPPPPPPGLSGFPVNGWTDNDVNDQVVRDTMDMLNNMWTNANDMFLNGAPAAKPIHLDLIDPHKVNYQNYMNLLPTEKELLEAGIESQGQNPTDWETQLLRSTPMGRGFQATGWG